MTANAFFRHHEVKAIETRRAQVLPPAGGWRKVLEEFKGTHRVEMQRDRNRILVLVIDFDGEDDRRKDFEAEIPAMLNDRVFVVGSMTEPEELRNDLGSYETIGRGLADGCRPGNTTTGIWTHRLLVHNADELQRMRARLMGVLFDDRGA